jgi:hypothetical protein
MSMDREEVILSLVKSGELEIDYQGRIWRVKKRHGYPRALGMGAAYQKAVTTHPCKRVRAEYPTKEGYLLISVTISGV